jgi:hypothetical protein
MDIQPLWVMISGEGHLHGFTHTYLGALLMGIVGALSGKYVAVGVFKWVKPSWVTDQSIRWWVVFFSAWIGSFSHVLLDSFMHADLQPFFPWRLDNSFLDQLSIDKLHLICVGTGVIGLMIYGFLFRLKASSLSSKN